MNKKTNIKNKLLLIQLNEINFDIIKLYLENKKLKNFKKIIYSKKLKYTSSENEYHLLEPWIQWTSVHYGLTAKEHGIYRLGDINNINVESIYERLEMNGFNVGAISPMNISNKLKHPSYFIPDPWTKTNPDNSTWSKLITKVVAKLVNNNASKKIDLYSLFLLSIAFIRFAKFRNYISFIHLAISSKSRKWRQAIFLDLFLNDVHQSLLNKKNPNFSSIFLNAGAHIQHHYLNNSKVKKEKSLNPEWYIPKTLDPFEEIIEVYDKIIGSYIDRKNYDIIIATGLTQKNNEKTEFYYRLKNHEEFLSICGLKFKKIDPLMSRDFVIQYETENQAIVEEDKIKKIKTNDGKKLFEIVDNRGTSIFVSLTYNIEITDSTVIDNKKNSSIHLKDFVSFVAIKNGNHSGEGFAYYSDHIDKFAINNHDHVKEISRSILNYFNILKEKS